MSGAAGESTMLFLFETGKLSRNVIWWILLEGERDFCASFVRLSRSFFFGLSHVFHFFWRRAFLADWPGGRRTINKQGKRYPRHMRRFPPPRTEAHLFFLLRRRRTIAPFRVQYVPPVLGFCFFSREWHTCPWGCGTRGGVTVLMGFQKFVRF